MDAILFKSNQETLAEVMIPVIDTDALLLCSDKKPVYKAFANAYHFTLETINLDLVSSQLKICRTAQEKLTLRLIR